LLKPISPNYEVSSLTEASSSQTVAFSLTLLTLLSASSSLEGLTCQEERQDHCFLFIFVTEE